MKNICFAILALFIHCQSAGQSANVPLNADYYHLLDRYEIRSGSFSPAYHSTFKAFTRQSVAAFADSMAATLPLNARDRFNLSFVRHDNWEWSDSLPGDSKRPFWKFYRKKSDFYHVSGKEFDLHFNPVAYFSLGREGSQKPYVNTRGVEIRGVINRKIGFYTFLGENQALLPGFANERVKEKEAVPSEGFWKSYDNGAVDFFTARAYISFAVTKNIGLQFGHDRFFTGNGYRSLVLSDYAPAYLFLKFNTRIWRLNYTNLFAQMTADLFSDPTGTLGGRKFPVKYFAFHHLSINLARNFNLGLFEAIVAGSELDINLLNPVIFYRSADQQQGSPYNAALGLDFRWIIGRRLSAYGQLMLDEFLLKEVRARNGWWSNKQAGQLGIKYINALGLPNLDLQLEANIARPYTYAHEGNNTSYSHYRQPLAHPLGANFRELIGILRYQPLPRLNITAKAFMIRTGEDSLSTNWGTDILKDYRTYEQEYGNKIGQGLATDIRLLEAVFSYQLKQNLFIDLRQLYRQKNSAWDARDGSAWLTSVSLRLNIPQRVHEF